VDLAVRRGARVAFLCALLSGPGVARAQFFSPGPLAHQHANLEGLENCSKCHDEQKGLAARLCLDCHTELAPRVAKEIGFHGRLPAGKRQDCQSCHPDHRGRDFALVEWEGPRDKFDHRKTGWALEGAHAKARCDDCHQRRLVVDPAVRRLLERAPKTATFLGTATRCDGCHFDEHRGQLGRECQKCHAAAAWKPAPSFDHQATSYPLRGKHKPVECGKCHPGVTDEHVTAEMFPKPRAAAFMQMKPIEHGSCESCHEDPHKGSFGPACSSCHSEAGWKVIKSAGGGHDAAFHDKTRFPLRGGHVGVDCKSCHGPFPGQPARFKGIPFASCGDCHADAHLGQLSAPPAARGAAACDRCHSVNGWLPPRYELEQHAATRFPLEGAHGAVACTGCHPTDPRLAERIPAAVRQKLKAQRRPERFALVVLRSKKTPAACATCHDDVHRGQLAVDGNNDACGTCHTTTSFTDLTFDHDLQSRFPLTGKHAQTPCAGCHKPEQVGTATMIRYKPLATACGSCHADTHQGQFLVAAASGVRAAAPGKERARTRDCNFCHGTKSFKKTTFDHDDPKFTSYGLEGKHAAVACERCHPTVRLAADVSTIRYRPLPRACEGCHVDFHRGEFRGFEP
jgi:hypothetical protein